MLATTTMAGGRSDLDAVRARLVFDTVRTARSCGFEIVVIDADSPAEYLREMRALGAHVYPQSVPGMGASRRQALRCARDLRLPDRGSRTVIWTEPERYRLIPHLGAAAETILSHRADMVTFARRSLTSYPPEQRHYYRTTKAAFFRETGIPVDYAFGPVALGSQALDAFLQYRGEYGDLWESILIPKLRAIAAGARHVDLAVSYVHSTEQSAAEAGNATLARRRREKYANVVGSMRSEVRRLRKLGTQSAGN